VNIFFKSIFILINVIFFHNLWSNEEEIILYCKTTEISKLMYKYEDGRIESVKQKIKPSKIPNRMILIKPREILVKIPSSEIEDWFSYFSIPGILFNEIFDTRCSKSVDKYLCRSESIKSGIISMTSIAGISDYEFAFEVNRETGKYKSTMKYTFLPEEAKKKT
jgi:hypothetical protein